MIRMNRIKKKLDVLKPHYCNIIDESYKHANHTDGALESHFKIRISTDAFIGKNLVMKHRMINELLADELANGLHALSIDIL